MIQAAEFPSAGEEYEFSMRSGQKLLRATVLEVDKTDQALRVRASQPTERLRPQLSPVDTGEVVRLWLPYLVWERA